MNSTTDDYYDSDIWMEKEDDEMKPMYIFIGSVLSLAGFTIALTGILYRCKKMKEKKERAKKYIVNGEV